MLLSSQHHALCSFPSPTARCRLRADGSSSRPRVGGGGRRRRRRRRRSGGLVGEFDRAKGEPTSATPVTTTTTRSTSSPGPRPAGAGGVISSPSNPFVKHCVKLRQSASYRRTCGCVLVVGLTPIREISYRYQESKGHAGGEEGDSCVDKLLLLDGAEAASEARALLEELRIGRGYNDSFRGDRVVRVSPVVMKKLAGLQSTDSTDAVAIMSIPKNFHDVSGRPKEEASCSSWFSLPPRRLLVLDGIQDPGNLGTLLRSTMAFKWDGVFLLPSCCDPFNDKALRAARGASFHLTIVTGDWVHLEDMKIKFRMRMLAAHPENIKENSNDHSSLTLSQELAESLADTPLCLTLGSEGQGLSRRTVHSSELVHIPMIGNFESLNVAVAGGIFLFMLQSEYCRDI